MTQFQRGIWSESMDAFGRNLDAVGVYMVALLVITAISEHLRLNSGGWIAETFATAYLAIPIHLTVMKQTSGWKQMANPENIKRVKPFVLRSIGLAVLCAIPIIIIIALMANQFSNGATAAQNIYVLAKIIIAAGAALIVSILAIFAKWGTMLPAAAVDGDASFSRAGERGSATFFYTLPRLFISMILLTVVLVAITHYTMKWFPITGMVVANNGIPNLTRLAFLILASLFGTFQVVMSAVILSRAYMIVEGGQSTPIITNQRANQFARPQASSEGFKPLFPGRR
jgi:hypothetical protein